MSESSDDLAGGLVRKEDEFVQTWIGVSYKLAKPPDVGALKRMLRGILDDLPRDDSLTIAELSFEGDQMRVVLDKGIVQ